MATQTSPPTWPTRVVGFALVSGAGLAIDFGLFLTLVELLNVRPGPANFISAAAAVTLVYFVSARRVFDYRGRFLLPLFALYVVYQVLAVAIASFAVDWLAANIFAPAIAKLVILPLTFTANFLFMSAITRTRPS